MLWYADEGPREAPAIVLLHGFASWSFSWRALRAVLRRKQLRVITIDLIGYGASERAHAPIYATDSQARLVIGILDQIGVARATLIGHSFGARIALQIALDTPERVERLVAIAPEALATERPPVAGLVRAPLIGYALAFYATSPALVRTGLKLAVRREECLTDGLIAGYTRPLYVRGSALSQVWQARSPKDGARPVPEHLGMVRCPTTLIWGEHDPIFPADQGRRLTEILPDARLVLIPRVGHIPHEEDEPTTTAAILTALVD